MVYVHTILSSNSIALIKKIITTPASICIAHSIVIINDKFVVSSQYIQSVTNFIWRDVSFAQILKMKSHRSRLISIMQCKIKTISHGVRVRSYA